MLRRLGLLHLCLLLSATATAAELRYGAGLHEAEWHLERSELACSLSQRIPRYGVARFSRKAGEPLTFSLEVLRPPPRGGQARLSAAPPDWYHQASLRDLGEVPVRGDRRAFVFRQTLSRRLLAELERGFFPTFEYRDWTDGRDQVRVRVSAVNLNSKLQGFLDCHDALLPFGFDEVAEVRLPFEVDSSRLGDRDKARLDKVVEYIQADEAVKRVKVDAYTDASGYLRHNRELAQKRAAAVKQYLLEKGLSESMLEVDAHGEKDPVASNASAQGRARNRRVVVRLVK